MIAAILGCVAFNRNAVQTEAVDSLPDSILRFENFTTVLPELPLRNLPNGFYLDSLFAFDSATAHHTTTYFPQRESDSVANAMIKEFCASIANQNVPRNCLANLKIQDSPCGRSACQGIARS